MDGIGEQEWGAKCQKWGSREWTVTWGRQVRSLAERTVEGGGKAQVGDLQSAKEAEVFKEQVEFCWVLKVR